MFQKIKENEYIQKFLELWNIPRYRSLIILSVYFIFFALIIASINTESNNKPINDKVDVIEEYGKINNYMYTATIKNESEQKLIGEVNNNKQIITFNETTYYYNDISLYENKNNIYTNTDNDLIEFEVWRFTPSFIMNLIKKGKLEAKTEYTDGMTSNTYLVNVSDFVKLYFGDDTESSENINIVLYKNNINVTKVELDLTNIYHQMQYSNVYNYKVILEYSLIGEIGPIIVNVESSD